VVKKVKLNKPIQKRHAGVLLHISSLPAGDFGADAYRFVDFLANIGASIWQTLPLNMPHDDGSPYQCLSAHAGRLAFISLESLVAQNLLNKNDLLPDTFSSQSDRHALFDKAYSNYKLQKTQILQKQFVTFCRQNAAWLNDFALFLVLRKKFHKTGWHTWPKAYKNKQPALMSKVKRRYATEIAVIKFTQFLFFSQWLKLKAYANKNGVAMFGDIPIFVAYDSADVWAHPRLFKLDANKDMQVVAGVPPDYFSETGQRWGNPHYNWSEMQYDGFNWWLERMRTQQSMFDLVRIDHFRGLQAAWEVPANADTAVEGAWILAPGAELLHAITTHFPNMQLIAEDLGIITVEVNALREQFHLPSMKILQFAFGGDDTNPYLPHNIKANSVAYTGTHDNDTTLGWYQTLDERTKNHLHSVLDDAQPSMPQALIALTMATHANLAIIPMQDILGLGAEHRMNTPGTMDKNWHWRFDWSQLKAGDIAAIKHVIQASNRAHKWH
jgi:4-alpha-glucanotransferase